VLWDLGGGETEKMLRRVKGGRGVGGICWVSGVWTLYGWSRGKRGITEREKGQGDKACVRWRNGYLSGGGVSGS